MKHLLSVALASGLLLTVGACGKARLVQQTRIGGELALDGNRKKALASARKHMNKHCDGSYTILEEGNVVASTDETKDVTEWRIKYVCGDTMPPVIPSPE